MCRLVRSIYISVSSRISKTLHNPRPMRWYDVFQPENNVDMYHVFLFLAHIV